MMNRIGLGNEEWVSSPEPWGRGPQRRWSRSRHKEQRSGRYEGSGVGMAGMAERYWKELRPSQAGRFRLDASIRPAREETGRDLRRPRLHARPRLRTTSR
jgi:SRSO17 transposase